MNSPVRPVRGDADIEAICRIYNHYVLHSTISFEETAVGIDEMRRRVHAYAPRLPWLVCEAGDGVTAYAYAVPWKARAAYRHSVECSVYVDPAALRHGYARLLYRELFERLRAAGICTAIAGIAQPNPASVALHEALGFRKVAHFERVGCKFGRWVDVAYWQLQL